VAVWAVLLNVPPPEVIDHAAVVVPPPKLAPLNVMAEGLADWQTVFGPAGVTVAAALTFIVRVALTTPHGPAGSSVVNLNVTVPLKFAAGV
jgi:hypothetical protein